MTVTPEPPAPTTTPEPPAPEPPEAPQPEAPDYMTKADFKTAMDEWQAERDAKAAEEAAKTAPAPKPKPKPEDTPAAPETKTTEPPAAEPQYGSKSWFNRR